jgi:K+-sensing histidine kinase KdpD
MLGRMPGTVSVHGVSDTRSRLLRPTSPPLMLGLVVGILLIAAESALVYLLERVSPGNIFGVVFLLGVLVVAMLWGFGLGATMALASAVVYVHFHHLQTS